MKKISLLIAGFIFISLASIAQEGVTLEQVSGPYITFQEETHDFGDITQGEKVMHTFAFENTGNQPLIITNVQVTCGCTATNWPRDPIAPGSSSELTVQFNSAGKLGRQNKVVTVVSNAGNTMAKVTITGNVLPVNKDTDSQ